MNPNRALLLITLLVLDVSGCIALPDIEPGAETPDAAMPAPDSGTPNGGQADAGNRFCGDGNIDRDLGEVCDDRNTVSGDGCSADCRSDENCGNGIRDTSKSEVCDDGNSITETECPYGMASCTRCNATCTQELTLSGPYCGDNIRNGTEACDDGNTTTETQCPYGTPSCKRCDAVCSVELNLIGAYCGDGTREGNETCDDGNTVTETACPYGTASCAQCSSTCSSVLNLTGPYCGDNIRNGAEACDDGNTTTETTCAYGTPTCSTCDATCANALSLTGPYCGDGIQNGSEACDDGNTNACGTCSSTCSQIQLSMAAGSITVLQASGVSDGNTLSLDDGVNNVAVFEFDSDGSLNDPGNIRIALSTSNDTLAGNMAAAINKPTTIIDITAQRSSNVVTLTNDRSTALGNRPISGVFSSNALRVSGMSGGAGADCPQGTGCARNEDCAIGATCLSSKICSAAP
jgi:cysteine-rich repeat protein